ncbi:Vps54-domain-containing protein [Trametes versicolor FP-101664 SS1]|uniref:Vps54-domain-containing protein n=1 Tax=Trametes versicolor (strain FP-101664) TaxID=717944 RepID=R7S6Y6_TRAVS|nr:Vps54-domain-containing protein [Trametes versicolor FP-101664 SS1]EIW51753.1 Vps54-domain-containing protein [Trametes versicolor FP-101664 SS1]
MSDYASTPSRPGSPIGELPSFSAARPSAYRFNWDSRRPGPGSVSETTEGRGDYFANNAPYDVYTNGSLANLALGAIPSEWSSSRHGFNAISNVVNSPRKKPDPPKAHSALPAVPPADLPRVRRKDFDSYLRAISPEWERFVQNAEQGRDGVAQIESTSSSSGIEVPPTPHTPRTPRPPSGKAPPPLETVPSVFFDASFNLGDPRTFNAVTEQREGEEDFTDPTSLSHSLPLLEKLSHYADTIEQHLVREISVRSTSFFAALANLQDLQTESEQCLDRISNLRGLLKDVDEKGAKRGLEIVRKEGKLRNMGAVKDSVRFVSGVMEMTGVARSLVAAGQWGEALDVIEELNRLWDPTSADAQAARPPPTPAKNGRSSPLPTVMESPPATPPPPPPPPAPTIPLSSLRAFAALPEHLRTLTMEITTSLSSEFVNLLRHDLVERIDSKYDYWPEAQRHDFNMSLKDRLRPLLQSLVRTKGILEATISWRDVVMTEVRSTIKRRIPTLELSDDDSIPQQSNAAAELRAMSHAAFMDVARAMYRSLLNCIEGLYRENAIIVEVVQSIQSPKASVDLAALQEELSDILSSAAELANARASKVMSVRAEQHTALDLPSFCALFNESWDFVVKSEIICRRMIVGLRGAIVSQAKSFLQHFHQTQLSLSAKLVEDEQWNAAEVAPSVQRIVDMMVDASIQDPPELLLNRPPSDTLSPLPPPSPAPSSPSLTVNGLPPRPSSPLPSPNFPPSPGRAARRRSANAPTKHLRVEDRPFFAVSATLDVLVLLIEYLKVIVNLPLLVTDTMSRVIELLKSFNSRTCQVVLGAGAMRSAGLKNITAKHLALASQSLAIMISLIPYVREAFRRHLSQKQAVMLIEFDKLKRDYQEHQNEIHAKLIAIMGDRLTAHIRSLQGVRWDVPKEGVNEYMEVLVKETVTLHKVLSRYLPSSIVEFVMTQVFAAINHRLSEEYAKIELPSLEAKHRLITDARYLQEKLTGLKNVAAPTAMLETVVSEKSVANRQAQQPAQPASAPQQPAVQSALNAGRFRGMLQRAGTLNGRHATAPPTSSTPPPALAPNVEKALPPAVVASPSPGPDSRVGTPGPPVDPMADNAPAAPTPPPQAPVVITEKSLVAEPDEANGDAAPESLLPVGEDAPPEIPPKGDTPAPDGDSEQPQADGELADEEAVAPAEEPHPLA